jgi:hypothetical protein
LGAEKIVTSILTIIEFYRNSRFCITELKMGMKEIERTMKNSKSVMEIVYENCIENG